jgi:Methyltransferase domain
VLGIWAIEFADMFPDAHVTGTDLSPCQPQWEPPNLDFQVDDANDDWTFKHKFDYIHVREMQMAIEEKKLFRQAYEYLESGRWLEIKAGTLPLRCDDDSFDGTTIKEWSDGMVEASKKINMAFDNPYHWKEWVEEAGFINITEPPIALPVNTWPKDPKMKETGSGSILTSAQGYKLSQRNSSLACWGRPTTSWKSCWHRCARI